MIKNIQPYSITGSNERFNGLPCAFQSWRRGAAIGQPTEARRMPGAEGCSFASIDVNGDYADICSMHRYSLLGIGPGFRIQLGGPLPATGTSNVFAGLYPGQCTQWRGKQVMFSCYGIKGAGYAGPARVSLVESETFQIVTRFDGKYTCDHRVLDTKLYDLSVDGPGEFDPLILAGTASTEMMTLGVLWEMPWAGSIASGGTRWVAFVSNTLGTGPAPRTGAAEDPNALALGAMYYTNTYPYGINTGVHPFEPGADLIYAGATGPSVNGGALGFQGNNMIAAPTAFMYSPGTGADAVAWNKTRGIDVNAILQSVSTSGVAATVSAGSNFVSATDQLMAHFSMETML